MCLYSDQRRRVASFQPLIASRRRRVASFAALLARGVERRGLLASAAPLQAGRFRTFTCAVIVLRCNPVAAAAARTLGYFAPASTTGLPNERRTAAALLLRSPKNSLAAADRDRFTNAYTHALSSGTHFLCSRLRAPQIRVA